MPAVEGGILPPGENRKIAQPLTNNQLLVLAERLPPGWKRRLYGRQGCLPLRRHCPVFTAQPVATRPL